MFDDAECGPFDFEPFLSKQDNDNKINNKEKLQTTCMFWLRGLCSRGDDCVFLHEMSVKKTQPCRFYFNKDSSCTHGAECQFSHDPETRRLYSKNNYEKLKAMDMIVPDKSKNEILQCCAVCGFHAGHAYLEHDKRMIVEINTDDIKFQLEQEKIEHQTRVDVSPDPEIIDFLHHMFYYFKPPWVKHKY